ncbi:hypothetical protein [Bacillus cereus]|uniref:hypothetical protein n=1 Tax=Bacillus cereus TaxID=1396 RepID=UPI00159BDF7E|nr:hypothetical protein [Bacillus cereus]HDR8447683.1 hypothetical protein [Bacillus cereus]HDR8462850.1 hypothetical protein [Bacillus cereus]
MKDKLEGVMRCSRYENEQLKREVKKFKEEKDELLEQLASCREHMLPLMENHNDYEELLALTVSDPLQISYLCKRIAEEANTILKKDMKKVYVMFHEGYHLGKSNIAVTEDREAARKCIQGFHSNGILAGWDELEVWDGNHLEQQEN